MSDKGRLVGRLVNGDDLDSYDEMEALSLIVKRHAADADAGPMVNLQGRAGARRDRC